MTWGWERVKDRIVELYINKNKSLDDVVLIINQEYGFGAKKRTYQKQLRRWEIYKRACQNSRALSPAQVSSREATGFDPGDLHPLPISPSNGGDSRIQPGLLGYSACTEPGSQDLTQPANGPGLELGTLELAGATFDMPSYHLGGPSVGLMVNAFSPQADEHGIEDTTNTSESEWETSYPEDSPISALATELKLPPPAIEIADAYITAHDISIPEYTELHQDISWEYIQEPGYNLNARKYAESTVVEISLRKLSDEHQRFLLLCSFLDGKKIPLELISRFLNCSQTLMDKRLLQLLQYRLVFRTCPKSISISPSIQWWLQERLPSDEHSLKARRDVIMKMSGSIFLDRMSSKEDWTFAQLATPHLEKIITLILQNDSELFWDEDVLKAAFNIADVARQLEINDKVIKVLEHIRYPMERRLGREHRLTLDTMNSLSVTYISTKNWIKAEQLLRTIVHIRRDSINRNEFCYLTELSNLIRVLVKRGQMEEARKLHALVSDYVKKFNYKDGRERIRIETKLGESFRFCGYLMEAEGHLLRLYKEAEEILGKSDPRTLRVLELLCHVYVDKKSWVDAERLGLRLAKLSKKALGETQTDTVRRIAFLEKFIPKEG